MTIYHPNNYSQIHRFTHYFINYCIFPFLFQTRYKTFITGKNNIPKERIPFIVMSNHLSNFDPPLICYALKHPIAYMAKEELFTVPVLKQVIEFLGAFSVNREKVEKATIKAAVDVLKKKWILGMFLEGTRSKIPGTLGKPNAGPIFISHMSKAPILPVGIIGSNQKSGKIVVNIGKLFYPNEDVEKGKLQCLQKLSELTGFKLPDNI